MQPPIITSTRPECHLPTRPTLRLRRGGLDLSRSLRARFERASAHPVVTPAHASCALAAVRSHSPNTAPVESSAAGPDHRTLEPWMSVDQSRPVALQSATTTRRGKRELAPRLLGRVSHLMILRGCGCGDFSITTTMPGSCRIFRRFPDLFEHDIDIEHCLQQHNRSTGGTRQGSVADQKAALQASNRQKMKQPVKVRIENISTNKERQNRRYGCRNKQV